MASSGLLWRTPIIVHRSIYRIDFQFSQAKTLTWYSKLRKEKKFSVSS
jgi:hypothetical protein